MKIFLPIGLKALGGTIREELDAILHPDLPGIEGNSGKKGSIWSYIQQTFFTDNIVSNFFTIGSALLFFGFLFSLVMALVKFMQQDTDSEKMFIRISIGLFIVCIFLSAIDFAFFGGGFFSLFLDKDAVK